MLQVQVRYCLKGVLQCVAIAGAAVVDLLMQASCKQQSVVAVCVAGTCLRSRGACAENDLSINASAPPQKWLIAAHAVCDSECYSDV